MQFENEKFEFLEVVALERQTAKALDYLPTPETPDAMTITQKWRLYRLGMRRDLRIALKDFWDDISDPLTLFAVMVLVLFICSMFAAAWLGPADFR